MSGKALTITKPKGKKGKTLRSPRPSTHRRTKEEKDSIMDEVEAFFKEHNIRENIREDPPTPKNKSKGKKGRKAWTMKTRKVRRT